MAQPERPAREIDSFEALEQEVQQKHGSDWAAFLRALENPADVLTFVLETKCGGDEASFEQWFKAQSLPEDWLDRFRIAQANARLTGGRSAP